MNPANILLAMDLFDSLMARGGKLIAGMRAAVSENRDLSDAEVQTFRDDAEQEDVNLEAAIEAKRQRDVAGRDSDKVTGETGGDIRP